MCCVVANETCVVRSRPAGNIYSIHRLPKTQLGILGMPKIRPLATANRLPKRQFGILGVPKTCHTRVSNMDRDACTCRLKQHLGFAQPTNPLRLLTPRWLCDGIALRAFHREGGAAPDALAGGRQAPRLRSTTSSMHHLSP